MAKIYKDGPAKPQQQKKDIRNLAMFTNLNSNSNSKSKKDKKKKKNGGAARTGLFVSNSISPHVQKDSESTPISTPISTSPRHDIEHVHKETIITSTTQFKNSCTANASGVNDALAYSAERECGKESLWEDAYRTAVYLVNSSYCKPIDDTKSRRLDPWGDPEMDDFSHLQAYGSKAFSNVPTAYRVAVSKEDIAEDFEPDDNIEPLHEDTVGEIEEAELEIPSPSARSGGAPISSCQDGGIDVVDGEVPLASIFHQFGMDDDVLTPSDRHDSPLVSPYETRQSNPSDEVLESVETVGPLPDTVSVSHGRGRPKGSKNKTYGEPSRRSERIASLKPSATSTTNTHTRKG